LRCVDGGQVLGPGQDEGVQQFLIPIEGTCGHISVPSEFATEILGVLQITWGTSFRDLIAASTTRKRCGHFRIPEADRFICDDLYPWNILDLLFSGQIGHCRLIDSPVPHDTHEFLLPVVVSYPCTVPLRIEEPAKWSSSTPLLFSFVQLWQACAGSTWMFLLHGFVRRSQQSSSSSTFIHKK